MAALALKPPQTKAEDSAIERIGGRTQAGAQSRQHSGHSCMAEEIWLAKRSASSSHLS